MAGRICTALVSQQTAASYEVYEEIQRASDVAYASEMKRDSEEERIATMNDKPEDAGHGALFKSDKKEKPSHPDYRGDVTIHGKKFWVSGWVREGQKGKYWSLAFRRAEEKVEEKPKPTPAAKASVADPFEL
jgi:hypothetical protein